MEATNNRIKQRIMNVNISTATKTYHLQIIILYMRQRFYV